MSEKLARQFWEAYQNDVLKDDPSGRVFDFLPEKIKTAFIKAMSSVEFPNKVPPGMELAPVGTRKFLKQTEKDLRYIHAYENLDEDEQGEIPHIVAGLMADSVSDILSRYPQPQPEIGSQI